MADLTTDLSERRALRTRLLYRLYRYCEGETSRQFRVSGLARPETVPPNSVRLAVRYLEERGLVLTAGGPTGKVKLTNRGARSIRNALLHPEAQLHGLTTLVDASAATTAEIRERRRDILESAALQLTLLVDLYRCTGADPDAQVPLVSLPTVGPEPDPHRLSVVSEMHPRYLVIRSDPHGDQWAGLTMAGFLLVERALARPEQAAEPDVPAWDDCPSLPDLPSVGHG